MKIIKNSGFYGFVYLVLRAAGDKLNLLFKRLNVESRFFYRFYGSNSIRNNKIFWNAYNWEKMGYEWGGEEFANRLFLKISKKVSFGGRILEIGPGAGRWTDFLIKYADNLILADISETCLELCKRKYSGNSNIKYYLNSGNDLRELDDLSVNIIWSFDVFVHINQLDTSAYFKEFKRILKKEGIGVIHHPDGKGGESGWRSKVNCNFIRTELRKNGFTLIDEIREWPENSKNLYGDVITIFRN